MSTVATRAELVAEILAGEARATELERVGDHVAEHEQRCELDKLREILAGWVGPVRPDDVPAIAAAVLIASRAAAGYVVQLPDGTTPGHVWPTEPGGPWGAQLVGGAVVTRYASSSDAAVRALVAHVLRGPVRPVSVTDRRDGYKVRTMSPDEVPPVALAVAGHARGLADAAAAAAAERVVEARRALAVALVEADRLRVAAAAAWVVEQAHQ